MTSTTASKSRTIAWVVWMIASVFYAYQYILRVMPSIMLDDIMQQFNVNAASFGQFSGVYYIGYSLIHLPVGIMLDRYGPRKVMSGCILLTVVGLMPLLFAKTWAYPVIGRLLIGIGSSAAILGVFKIVRVTFSEERFARMLSFSVTIGLIGAIYGGAPVSYMRDMYGYQSVIELIAIAGIVLAAATYWIVPEIETSSEGTVFTDIKEVLTNGRVIWSCICAGLMVGPLEGFADVWVSAFLRQVYGYDSTVAASLPSMIYIGMCFGAPALSFIADRLGSYTVAIIAAGSLMALGFAMMLVTHLPASVLSVCFVMIGVCSGYQILAIYKASTYVREQVAGLTTAMANMIIMIFGYAFHTTMGSVISSMGGATNSQALVYGVAVVPAALCIGTAGFILLAFQASMKKRQEKVAATAEC